jgi:hypothetical protein
MRWLRPGEVPTLGNWFRAAGYDTHYDGKWHISHADLTDPATGQPLATNDDDGVVDQSAVQRYLDADPLAAYGFSGWVGPEPHGALLANAPQVAQRLGFVMPAYQWWERGFYGVGLKAYDALAGRQGLGGTEWLSTRRTLELLPGVRARGLWGGVQINGNGLTNKCTDADRAATSNNVHNCHVTAEGRPASYGGNNSAENSGILRYVQIRHAGYEVVDGNELNALTLNGVGSGTTLEYVQTYTTLDDGIEMFGGAVDLKYSVNVNVGDDSIDFSEGWVGDIQFALIIQTSGSNRCIEADNTGDTLPDNIAPFTKGRVSNMTCITSNVKTNAGTAPSSKGDAEGPLFREGSYFELYNSIITSNATGMASQECFEVEHTQTVAGIQSGFSVASGNVVACTEAIKIASSAGLNLRDWWVNSGNAVVDATANLPATVITGLSPTNARAYVTAPSMTTAAGAAITVPVFDVTRLRNTFSAAAVPALGPAGSSSFFEAVDFIGAVKTGQDWVSGWTTGL